MSAANPALVSLIGERVRARRHARGFTLDELAERSGVSRRMLVNVEQGATNASIATLLRLSEALGIGLPDLVAPGDGRQALEVNRAGSRPALWTGARGGEAVLAAGTAAPETVGLDTRAGRRPRERAPRRGGTRAAPRHRGRVRPLGRRRGGRAPRGRRGVLPRRRGARVPQRRPGRGPVRAHGLRADAWKGPQQ